MAAGECGDVAGELVGTAMAAKERHNAGAVLGDDNYGRLRTLVGDHSGKRSNKNPACANTDDRCSSLIECPDMVERLGEGDVGAGNPVREAVQPGARDAGSNVLGCRTRSRRQDEDGGGSIQASSPL